MTIILASVAWLLTYLVHSTVFLLGAAALCGLGVVRSHGARDTLWKVALLGGLLTASAQTLLRLQPWPGHVALTAVGETPLVDVAQVRTVRPAAPESTPAAAAFASTIAQHRMAELPPPPPQRSVRRLVSGVHIGWPAIVLNLWFVSALAFGARLVWMRVSFTRRLKERRTIAEGALVESLAELCATSGVPVPRLSVSDRINGPIAFGREICVPERVVSQLAPAEQRAVLAHELGHVVRRDPAWLTLSALLESVFVIQPLNAFGRRRMREASEYLCDDWAAERTSGVALATCLARVAEWVQGEQAPAIVAGMAGRCSELVARVERLLEGASPVRPGRATVRVGAGVLMLALVACGVPGVTAEDINDASFARPRAVEAAAETALASQVAWDGDAWAQVADNGAMLVFAPGYSARLIGHGRLSFRQYGRAIVVPEGYRLTVAGRPVTDQRDLCDNSGAVRIEGADGVWDVVPVHLPGASRYAGSRFNGDLAGLTAAASERAAREAEAAIEREVAASRDAATDAALDGEVDVAIDTLVQLWVRDPDAVRRAARRIARTYDRELQPQFESLGVQLGRELAPQLQRLTSRVGRDLTPEFQRLGAELGAEIVASLGDLARDPDGKAHKRPIKH